MHGAFRVCTAGAIRYTVHMPVCFRGVMRSALDVPCLVQFATIERAAKECYCPHADMRVVFRTKGKGCCKQHFLAATNIAVQYVWFKAGRKQSMVVCFGLARLTLWCYGHMIQVA